MCFAAFLHLGRVRFSSTQPIVSYFIQLNEAGFVGTDAHEALTCVQRAVWGML